MKIGLVVLISDHVLRAYPSLLLNEVALYTRTVYTDYEMMIS